ncbi:hypothetical protein EDB89DRAFT_1916555 [Lactarius sanguifluus]|nr:hypothetical protein EDB89DRAFT_1916555 [Lactarius sanguifluus]
MMFMRTILALSLAAFALAVPQPQDDALVKVIADVQDVLSGELGRCTWFANTHWHYLVISGVGPRNIDRNKDGKVYLRPIRPYEGVPSLRQISGCEASWSGHAGLRGARGVVYVSAAIADASVSKGKSRTTSHAGSSCIVLQQYEERFAAELLALHQDVLSRLMISPTVRPCPSRPRGSRTPRFSPTPSRKQMRSMMGTNSDLQVQLANRIPSAEAERDQLHAKVDEIQALMLLSATNAATSQALAVELGEVLSLERLLELEKLSQELNVDKQALVSKVHNPKARVGFASRDKDAAVEALTGPRKENGLLVLPQNHWEDLRRANERPLATCRAHLAVIPDERAGALLELTELRRVWAAPRCSRANMPPCSATTKSKKRASQAAVARRARHVRASRRRSSAQPNGSNGRTSTRRSSRTRSWRTSRRRTARRSSTRRTPRGALHRTTVATASVSSSPHPDSRTRTAYSSVCYTDAPLAAASVNGQRAGTTADVRVRLDACVAQKEGCLRRSVFVSSKYGWSTMVTHREARGVAYA